LPQKMYLMASRIIELNCPRPNERTVARLVACLIAAQQGFDDKAMAEADGPEALELVDKMKEHFEVLRNTLPIPEQLPKATVRKNNDSSSL
jgi:hypothetical protein